MAAQVHALAAAEADGECERQSLPSPSHAGPSDAWGVRQLRTPRPSLGDIAAATVTELAVPKLSGDQRVTTSTQTVTPSPSTRTTPVRERRKRRREDGEEEGEEEEVGTCPEERDASSAPPTAPSNPKRIKMKPSCKQTVAGLDSDYGPCAGVKDCIVVGGDEFLSSDENDDDALEHCPEADDDVMSLAPQDDSDYVSDTVDTHAASRSPRTSTPITPVGDTSSRETSQATVQASKQSPPPPPPPPTPPTPPGGALEVTTQLSNVSPPQTRSDTPASARPQSRKRQRSPEDQPQQLRPSPFYRRSPGKGSRDSPIDLTMTQTPSITPEPVLRHPPITPGSDLAQVTERPASPPQLTSILAMPDALGMQQPQLGSSAHYYQPQQRQQQPVEHQQPRHHFPPPPAHLILPAQQLPRTLPPTQQQPLPPQQRLPPHQPPPALHNSPCCPPSPHQEQPELQRHHGSHDPYALAMYYASAATGISREVHQQDHPQLRPQNQDQQYFQPQPEQEQDRSAFRRLPRNLGPAHRPRQIPRYRARTPPPVTPAGNNVRLPSFAEMLWGIPATAPSQEPAPAPTMPPPQGYRHPQDDRYWS